MTVIRDIAVKLDMQQILRHQGIKESSARLEMIAMTQELLSVAELHLLKPVATYNSYTIVKVTRDEIRLDGSTALSGRLLFSALKEASELVVVVCAIGPKLEEKVADYSSRNGLLKGVLLDGIGSTAVDATLREFCRLITQEAASHGYQSSRPLSPGMSGFPLSEQKRLLKLASAEGIGVSLTSSGVMVPRKSISAVIGIGPKMPAWTRAEACSCCHLKKTCHYRIYV